MKYRRFGKTEEQIPVISCGGMRYQHKWDDVPLEEVPSANQENLKKTIFRSLDLGINHIETARDYGTSEMQLGLVLPQLPRDEILVQTKIPPFANPKDFVNTFNKSMDYLNLDYVDFLSIHGINNQELLDYSIAPGGCLDAARKLQNEGRCKHVGFATHATTDIIHIALETNGFDYINLHWYFVNDLNKSAIELAHSQDMGVFIISPNDKGGKLYEPSPKLTDLCSPLTPMQFNDLYCLRDPKIHTLSCGAAKPTDFDEHVAAVDMLDDAEKLTNPIEKKLREEMEKVLGKDWCEGWWKGLPNYVDVPNEVNIVEILRLWTYSKALDISGWGKMRYNLLDGAAEHWFPGRKVPVNNIDSIAPALENSPFKEKLPAILKEAHKLLDDTPMKRLSQSDE